MRKGQMLLLEREPVTYLKCEFSKPCKEFTDVTLEVRSDVPQKQKSKNLK